MNLSPEFMDNFKLTRSFSSSNDPGIYGVMTLISILDEEIINSAKDSTKYCFGDFI